MIKIVALGIYVLGAIKIGVAGTYYSNIFK